MAYTIDDYNALKAAIAQGASKVKFADKETEFRTLAEMRDIKREMEIELGLAQGGIKTSFAKFSRGLNDC